MTPENEKPQALSHRVIYTSPWVNLYVDRVQLPNGSIREAQHVVDFETHAVLALARANDGRYLMVRQFRYATGQWEWEFPAGRLEAGEAVIDGAAREVLEETGCRTSAHELLYTYNPMNGIANSTFHIVRCRATLAEQDFDTDEISAVAWIGEQEIERMIRCGEMRDGYSLTAFLMARFFEGN